MTENWPTLYRHLQAQHDELNKSQLHGLSNSGFRKIKVLRANLADRQIIDLVLRIHEFPAVEHIVFPTGNIKASLPKLKRIEIQFENLERLNESGEVNLHFLLNFKGQSLQVLKLSQKCIEKEDQPLFRTVQWPEIFYLDFERNRMERTIFKNLADRRDLFWQKLAILNLRKCNVDSWGAMYLSGLKLPNLTRLDLNDNNINDKGIYYMTNAEWKNLQYLDIRKNIIGHMGLDHFLRRKLSSLRCLLYKESGDLNWKEMMALCFMNLVGSRAKETPNSLKLIMTMEYKEEWEEEFKTIKTVIVKSKKAK